MITYELRMTQTEIKPITVQVLDLQDSEVLSGAVVTHTPPSGTALSVTPSIDPPYINMLFGPFAVNGKHYVLVQAAGDAGSKPEVLYIVDVVNAGTDPGN